MRPVGRERKLDALREVLEDEGMGIGNAVVVGDSITDRNMLRAASLEGGLPYLSMETGMRCRIRWSP